MLLRETSFEEIPTEVNVGIADVTDIQRQYARKLAAERLGAQEQSAEKKNWIARQFTRAKNAIVHEYRQAKHRVAALRETAEQRNVFLGEDDGEARTRALYESAADRVISGDDSILSAGEKVYNVDNNETRQAQVSENLRTFLIEFLKSQEDIDSFRSEVPTGQTITYQELVNQQLDTLRRIQGGGQETITAHNFFVVCREVKSLFEGLSADEKARYINELHISLKIAIAEHSLSSKYKGRFGRWCEKIKVTRVFNGTTLAVLAGAAASVAKIVSKKAAEATLAVPVVGSVIGGAFAGSAQYNRRTTEAQQYYQNTAAGETYSNDKVAAKFEKFSMDLQPAQSIISELRAGQEYPLESKLELLIRYEDLIKSGNIKKVELIQYDPGQVEAQHREIAVLMARLRAGLKKELGNEFNNALQNARENPEISKTRKELIESISKHKRGVKSMLAKEAAITGSAVFALSFAFGIATAEIWALIDDSTMGLVESWFTERDSEKKATLLMQLKNLITGGGTTTMSHSSIIQGIDGKVSADVRLPDGFCLEQQGNGVALTGPNGVNISIPDAAGDGVIGQDDIQKALAGKGFTITETPVPGSYFDSYNGAERPAEFKSVRMDNYYDYDTKEFARNELDLKWGGPNGSGVIWDADGNVKGYEMSIADMFNDESTFGSNKLTGDQIKEMVGKGKIKLMLYEGSEKLVTSDSIGNKGAVFIEFDKNGKAFIPNTGVNSEFLHVTEDGKFELKGQILAVEVLEGDGSDTMPYNVRSLARIQGENFSNQPILDIDYEAPNVYDTDIHVQPIHAQRFMGPTDDYKEKHPDQEPGRTPDNDERRTLQRDRSLARDGENNREQLNNTNQGNRLQAEDNNSQTINNTTNQSYDSSFFGFDTPIAGEETNQTSATSSVIEANVAPVAESQTLTQEHRWDSFWDGVFDKPKEEEGQLQSTAFVTPALKRATASWQSRRIENAKPRENKSPTTEQIQAQLARRARGRENSTTPEVVESMSTTNEQIKSHVDRIKNGRDFKDFLSRKRTSGTKVVPLNEQGREELQEAA